MANLLEQMPPFCNDIASSGGGAVEQWIKFVRLGTIDAIL